MDKMLMKRWGFYIVRQTLCIFYKREFSENYASDFQVFTCGSSGLFQSNLRNSTYDNHVSRTDKEAPAERDDMIYEEAYTYRNLMSYCSSFSCCGLSVG